jgi:hypothetical protein
MSKILRIRKSIWAAICLWLGLVRGYELPAQVETALPKISNSSSLNVFNLTLTQDSLLRIFGRGVNGTSLGYSPVLRNVDQPKGAFVESMQQANVPQIRRTSTTRTRCTRTTPTPPPLPPVSTLQPVNPVPPVTCTQITEQHICTTILGRTHCHTNVCCIRGGVLNHCVKVSSSSYGGTHFRTTTTTTCVSHLSCRIA